MNCDFCSQPITEEARATVPCCERVYHTVCLIKKSVTEAHASFHDITTICCGCQTPIYTEYYTTPDVTQAVETFLQSPENRNEVRQIRRKSTIAAKSRAALNKFIRERKGAWKALVQPHIESIKNLKQVETFHVKNSPQWKEYAKHERARMKAYTEFKKIMILGRQ
jgi:hypothetical protein